MKKIKEEIERCKEENIIAIFDKVSNEEEEHTISAVNDSFFDSNIDNSFSYTAKKNLITWLWKVWIFLGKQTKIKQHNQ